MKRGRTGACQPLLASAPETDGDGAHCSPDASPAILQVSCEGTYGATLGERQILDSSSRRKARRRQGTHFCSMRCLRWIKKRRILRGACN
jgi:hypothetical protein